MLPVKVLLPVFLYSCCLYGFYLVFITSFLFGFVNRLYICLELYPHVYFLLLLSFFLGLASVLRKARRLALCKRLASCNRLAICKSLVFCTRLVFILVLLVWLLSGTPSFFCSIITPNIYFELHQCGYCFHSSVSLTDLLSANVLLFVDVLLSIHALLCKNIILSEKRLAF